ncbi:MAG: PQQ-binding-like beta-propeller repeat protein [Acidobacteria bacterium]|nr:PQQ-binding-like beta-propeller repeat protein [Acidobacteriota bacterium]
MRFLLLWLAVLPGYAADAEAGRKQYAARCAMCHGADGAGGERGPGITAKLDRPDLELMKLIADGLPAKGMPPTNADGGQVRDIIAFLRTIQTVNDTSVRERIRLASGAVIEGVVRGRSNFSMQVQMEDGIRLLRRVSDGWQDAKAGAGWGSYHGAENGNRHSKLRQIDTSNVARMSLRWAYSIPSAGRLQVTPVVVDGVMYVTAVNQVHALDSGTGRVIWKYQRPRSSGLVGDAASGINRGVAVAGRRLFMVTDNAHLLAIDRITGKLLWDREMADSRDHYGATAAPLVIHGLVVSGISGGDEGVRGFLAAFSQETGERVWQFWTVPKRGEPLAETWKGDALEHGCATTWLTGSYDASQDLLLWPTGNPCPDYNGDGRIGDNLYSDSVLALEPRTGKLRWHYQFTPHDTHDWDAQEPLLLVDAEWQGRVRKLVLQANRNGFFYVLDRETGRPLLAKPFVKKLTWAREIGPDGRPVLNPGALPAEAGVRACPAVEGATNWFSSAFHPGTQLFYVQALEKCNIYTKKPGEWVRGQSYYDGTAKGVPGEPGQKFLRAIDFRTGKVVWEYAQSGTANSWGGVLSTDGGLVFFGEDSGAFAAADAKTGKLLWHVPLNETWKASPMTYEMDGRQLVGVAAGGSVMVFGVD